MWSKHVNEFPVFFGIYWKLDSSISQKMLEIKSRHLTWVGNFFCTYSMSCEMESVTNWIDDFPPIFFFCWIAKNHTSKTQQKVFSSTIKRADRTQIRKNGFCVHNSQLHSAFYFSIEFRKIYSWFKIKWVQRITLYPSTYMSLMSPWLSGWLDPRKVPQ